MKTNGEVRDILRNERKKRNMSQKDVGDLLYMPMSTYGSYENGHTDLKLNVAELLLNEFGLTLKIERMEK